MERRETRIEAIINPVSGVDSKRKIPEMIRKVCSDGIAKVTISFTEYAGHASELTKQALQGGANIILAVGGDGTVNEIARTMIGTQATLGIIPKGSGNGLARELNIPMDTRRALEVIMSGHTITIDSCKANDRTFFCTCGVGFDAAVSQKFAAQKHRGSLTYIRNTIEEYLSYKPEVYELQADNLNITEKAFLVACANASQYGNNAFIAPHASTQDGQMDITILSPFTPLDIAPLAVQLFTKQIDHHSKIKTLKASRLSIIRQQPGVMHLDGEPVMADARIDITIQPKTLNVIVPREVSFTQEVSNFFGQVTRFFDQKLPFISR